MCVCYYFDPYEFMLIKSSISEKLRSYLDRDSHSKYVCINLLCPDTWL